MKLYIASFNTVDTHIPHSLDAVPTFACFIVDGELSFWNKHAPLTRLGVVNGVDQCRMLISFTGVPKYGQVLLLSDDNMESSVGYLMEPSNESVHVAGFETQLLLASTPAGNGYWTQHDNGVGGCIRSASTGTLACAIHHSVIMPLRVAAIRAPGVLMSDKRNESEPGVSIVFRDGCCEFVRGYPTLESDAFVGIHGLYSDPVETVQQLRGPSMVSDVGMA